MAKLAINGGTPVKTKPFPTWPIWNQNEINNLNEIVESGKWGALHGDKVKTFADKFADYHQAKYGICVNSGTTLPRLPSTLPKRTATYALPLALAA